MSPMGGVPTPIKAIRTKCVECCAGSRHEVGRCHIEDCSLWPYRKGRRPTSEMAKAHVAAVSKGLS